MSPSEVLALSKDNDGFGNSWFGMIIVLFFLVYGMGGNWGNNGFANAIGYENLATSNEVQRGFDNQNLQAQTRDILAAVNAQGAASIAATNQTFHDTLMANQNLYNEVQRDIAGIALGQANILANQNECCCSTKMLISENAAQQRYESAMQNNAVLQAIQADGAATRAMIQQDKIEALQNQLNQVQLAQALQGVVRYPDSFAYNAGSNPFCSCGCAGNI